MIIQMVYQMSGGRYDGRNWPVTGVNFEVSDEEGQGLVGCGAAVYVGPSAKPEDAKPDNVKPEDAKPDNLKPADAKSDGTGPDNAEPDDAATDAAVSAELASGQPLPRPAPGDPKLAWVLYAVSQGASRGEAEESTKAQLQAAYGSSGSSSSSGRL